MTRPLRHLQIRNPQSAIRNAFTLIELLVSIAILALLAGLTVKGVSKFRQAGWQTSTQNQLMTIQNAIQNYYSTFHAYPGPIPNRYLGATQPISAFPQIDTTNSNQFDVGTAGDLTGLTGAENLVLGLFGGLWYDQTSTPPIVYDPARVGQGPASLNALAPKKYGAFLEAQDHLSWRNIGTKKSGDYEDDAGKGNDTIIPEIVDRFPQGMPILYLRADKGSGWTPSMPTNPSKTINNVISDDSDPSSSNPDPTKNLAQYHLNQIKGYTEKDSNNRYIGENKKPIKGVTDHGLRTVDITKTLDGDGPFDAYPYLTNLSVSSQDQSGKPGSGHVARKKDEYILISAGIDRIYGTKDDITNFGSVGGD